MFKQCLLDIEIANEHGYKTDKLRSRKLQASAVKTSKSVSKIKHVEVSNVQLPNKLVCKNTSYLNRGLYAARNISDGERILIEDAFAFWLSPKFCYQKCNFCWRSYENFIPCPDCTDTVFCDAICLEKAYFHANECSQNKKYSEIDPQINVIISRTLRSLSFAIDLCSSVDEMWKFFIDILCEGEGISKLPDKLLNSREKYAFFLTLGVVNPKSAVDKNSSIFLKKMATAFYMNKQWLSRYSSYEQNILKNIYLYHAHILSANSFTGNGSDTCFDDSVCYLFASLFNHDCSPNADCSFIGKQVIVTSTRKIMKNEQVFIAYYSNADTDKRRKYLKDSFGFICRCDLCVWGTTE